MRVSRYILVEGVKTKDNQILPIWDSRINYTKSDDYGDMLSVEDNRNIIDTIECIYDIKTKTISAGVEINIYPSLDEMKLKKGEKVLYEKTHKHLFETSIIDIEYNRFDLSIYKGKKIDKWWLDKIKDITIEKDGLYAVKLWKPTYVLENGVKTEYEHQLFHKLN